ncbi:MAG: hypothetical protein HC830_14310 [Bacteroidetes bacterium]|nr:hypothetical protein [Bacteroidota bacterium]
MRFTILVSILFFFISCQKEADDTAGFTHVEIADAHGIFLANYVGSEDSAVKLFKLTSSDNLEEIKYTKANGETVFTNRAPVAIYNLNESYFLVTFQYGKTIFTKVISSNGLMVRFNFCR